MSDSSWLGTIIASFAIQQVLTYIKLQVCEVEQTRMFLPTKSFAPMKNPTAFKTAGFKHFPLSKINMI